MKSLQNIIIEKLKITKDTKINQSDHNYKDIIIQKLKYQYKLKDYEYVIDVNDEEISVIFDFKDHRKYDPKYMTDICRGIYNVLKVYNKNIDRPTLSKTDNKFNQIIYKFKNE